MYSQAIVRAGKWLRPPIRALPSVIVDTEKKVLREADGPDASDSTTKEILSLLGAPASPCQVSRQGVRRSQATGVEKY